MRQLPKITNRALLAIFMALSLFPTLVYSDVNLRLMTWLGYAPETQVKTFEKAMKEKYQKQVKVTVHYINSYEEAFSFIRRGEADIVTLVDHILHDGRFQYIRNQLILPLKRDLIPNYQSVFKTYKPYGEHDGQVYGVPVASGPYGLAYNTRYFKEAPKSWNILWDEQYKGKYAITNGIFEVNLYITALSMGYSREDLGNFEKLNNLAFKTKLRALVKNSESFWPGIDEGHHLKGLHLATSWGFSMPELKRLGENWKMAEPEEGSPTWIDVNTINQSVAGDPLKYSIAHEWINFTISPDFQIEAIVNGIATPPVTETAKSRLSHEQIKDFNLDDKEFLNKYRVVYPTIKFERNRNGIRYLWEEASKGISKKVRPAPNED